MDIKLTKEEFTKLYLDTSRPIKKIAESLGLTENQMVVAAKKLGISRRKNHNRLVIED